MVNITVLNQNNVNAPATPPVYWVWENASLQLVRSTNINNAGGVVPNGLKSWQALFDCSGLPDNQELFTLTLEFRRGAWTDVNGVNHPNGEWLPDLGPDIIPTGPNLKTGSKVAEFGSTIGAVRGSDGSMIEPYPDRYRFRISSCPGWTIPNVKLILTG